MNYFFEWTVPTFFYMSVGMGVRHRSNYTLFMEQGGTILPDIIYYDLNTTNKDDRNTTKSHAGDRRLLFNYYKTLMLLTGVDEDEAAHMANQTMAVETMIAQVINRALFCFTVFPSYVFLAFIDRLAMFLWAFEIQIDSNHCRPQLCGLQFE